tara:strand:+ start:80 stop:784 length:705 start_codon:yes stop_codon:yes gene_type:complete
MNVVALNKEETTAKTLKMPNNLDVMIRRSGMLNKDVAERKGIRPETVSRHISGALQFTLKDAEEYAVILGCTPQDILFAQNAVPLFGYLNGNQVNVCDPTEAPRAFYTPYITTPDRRFVMSNHTAQNKRWANGRMYSFSNLCIEKQVVDEHCFMRLSIVKIKGDKQVRFGVVYPEPGGTFSIGFNSDSHTDSEQGGAPPTLIHTEIKKEINLAWATPIISCILQPDLMGMIEKK